MLIGSISSVFYVGGVLFLDFWRIDDPLEVFPVHCLGGVWGLFATGFFDNTQGALFHGAIKQGEFMGYQIVGIVVILAWTSLISIPTFLILRKLHLLRIDPAIEEIGIDVAELGGVSEEFLDAVREQIKAKKNMKFVEETVEEVDEEQLRIKAEKERAAQKAKARGPPRVELQGEDFIF